MRRREASTRAAIGQVLVIAASLLGCGDDDDDAPGRDAGLDAGDAAAEDGATDAAAADPCTGVHPFVDLLEAVPIVSDLGVGARSLATDGTTALVCGDGFVRAVDLAAARAGDLFAIDGACRGAAVAGSRAAVTSARGEVVLLALSAGATLAEAGRATPAGALGGALFSDDVLLVAAGAAGVLRFDVSADELTPLAPWTSVGDARSLAPAGSGRVAVADGALGVALLDRQTGDERARLAPPIYEQLFIDPDAPGGVREVALPFEAIVVAVDDDFVLAGCGGYGTVRATRDGDVLGPALRSPPPFGRPAGVEGVAWDVALDGGEIVYADGLALVRMGLAGDAALTYVARETRDDPGALDGAFWLAVERAGDEVLALSTRALVRLVRAPADRVPSIDLGRPTVSVRAPAGGDETVLLQIGNLGEADLGVRIVGIEPADVFAATVSTLPGAPGADPDDPSCLRVPAGPAVGAVEIRFTPRDDAPIDGTLLLATADPDLPEVRVPVHGNPDVLAPGDVAPDFALPSLAGDLVRLSDLAGDVVLLKFWNYQ